MRPSPPGKAALIAAVLALMAAACAREGGASRVSIGTASLLEGAVFLVQDGERTPLAAATPTPVGAGDVVAAGEAGVARVSLGDDGSFEVRGGSLVIVGEGLVAFEEGSVLVETESPLEVRAAGSSVRLASGAVRLDGPAMGRIGAYDSERVEVVRQEQSLELPRYWQFTVNAAGEVEQARPLQISSEDDWDRRLVTEALQTDAAVNNLATGFDAQFGSTTPPALLERLAAVGIGADALAPFAASPRSDLVLALAFAEVWKGGPEAEVSKAFIDSLTLNTAGASWGLLAEQFGVDPQRFIERFQAEINAIPIAPPPPPPAARTPVGRTPPRATPAAPRPPAPPGTPPAQPSPAGSVSPGSPPPESLLPGLSEELARIINELYGIVDDLLPIL